jgi:hypothetical protein
VELTRSGDGDEMDVAAMAVTPFAAAANFMITTGI